MNKLVCRHLSGQMEIPRRTRAAACPVSGEGYRWEERAPGPRASPNPGTLDPNPGGLDPDLEDQNRTYQFGSYHISYYILGSHQGPHTS